MSAVAGDADTEAGATGRLMPIQRTATIVMAAALFDVNWIISVLKFSFIVS